MDLLGGFRKRGCDRSPLEGRSIPFVSGAAIEEATGDVISIELLTLVIGLSVKPLRFSVQYFLPIPPKILSIAQVRQPDSVGYRKVSGYHQVPY
jgi:hypothetical protein